MAVPRHSDAEWAEAFRHQLDGNPTPGDPEQITAYAKKFKDLADMCGNYRTKVVQAQQPNAEFQGKAAEAYRQHLNDLPPLMLALQARFTVVWGALTTWARDLPDFQQRAETAFQAARSASQAMDAAQKKADAKGAKPEDVKQARSDHDHQHGAFQQALRDARKARDDHNARAREAARSIHLAADDDLKNPSGFWHGVSNVIHKVATVVSKWSSWISTIAGVLALICAIVPGLEELAPIFAAIALVAGLFALASDSILMAYGDKGWTDVGLDVVGVLPFGRIAKLGRVAKMGVTELRGAKGLARSADAVAGKFPEVAAAMHGLAKDAPKFVAKDVAATGKSFRFAYTVSGFKDDMADAGKMYRGTRSAVSAAYRNSGFGGAVKTYGGLAVAHAKGAASDAFGFGAGTAGQWAHSGNPFNPPWAG